MSSLVSRKAQCLSLLQDCLALQLQRVAPPNTGPSNTDTHYWMYDSGYLLFQGFLEANLKCFWDGSLVAAVRGLEFRGYVCPGVLLVTGNPPSLHLIRSAWSRNVLKPPPNYIITLLGDVEDCTVSKIKQAGFTPLSDAVCWVILQLGASGQNAVLDTIKSAISSSFPGMEKPSTHLLYDTLADLMANNKVYQTSQGYFVATPDSVRLEEAGKGRSMLLSQSEVLTKIHGEIITIREGSKTHQSIQTNLADVICGGNKNDKVIYPRSPTKISGTRKLERRHSMRLLGSSRKLSTLHRAGSVRLLQNNSPDPTSKKSSLFSKIFRWPRRLPPPSSLNVSISDSYPPPEWFNSSVAHLQSVGTQTQTMAKSDSDWMSEYGTLRSRRRSLSTSRLPRRRSRAPSMSPSRPSSPSTPSSSKTVLCAPTPKAMSSASSGYNSLPRSVKSKTKKSLSCQSSPKLTRPNIKVELSSNPSAGIISDTKVDTHMTASINEPNALLTTTINGPNSTKIYVQQQNSPMRSVITFERDDKKTEYKRSRRPTSLYKDKKIGHLENNLKMKFPSTETIQLEEKCLSGAKIINENQNVFDIKSLKAGSLVDVADVENGLNNRKSSFSSLQPEKVLSYKNIFKATQNDFSFKKDDKNILNEQDKELCTFPSLSDLSLHFTSIAAQKILKGVSINSIDTLVEVNMAAEKSHSDVPIRTDLGVV